MTEEMSIVRALNEVKLIDNKINKAVSELIPVAVLIGKNEKPTNPAFTDKNELKSKMQGKYDSVISLMDRYKIIKQKIVESNAITMVEIGGVKMTVASAIERKKSIMFEKLMLQKFKNSLAQASLEVNAQNIRAEDEISRQLTAVFGKDQSTDKVGSEAITNQIRDRLGAKMFDPLSIKDKIEKLELDIQTFESEVDLVLSESNAITKIKF